MRENDNHPLTNGTYDDGSGEDGGFSRNQRVVLGVFKRTGTATLEEVRRSSPHWNQAVGFLRRKGYVQWLNDGGYALTPEGGKVMPFAL